jgi:hypothetical protein
MKNINTQSETIPDQIDGTYPPTIEQLRAAGWRDVPPQPPLEAGFSRVSATFGEGLDGVTGAWTVVDRATVEIDAEQAAVDLAVNGERYVLENQYILLCDVLRQALGQAPNQQKLGFDALPVMMLTLKAANKDAYEKFRDAMDMLNSALIRYDVRWWDGAVWHAQPELAEATNAIMGMV